MKKNSIMENNPELAKEWHPTLNGDLTPESVKPFSMKKVWWQCKEHQGHVWNASPNARQFGAVCPYCSNRKALQGYNDLSTTHPELAKEWHPTLNDGLSANELTASSSRDAWWLCDKGHEWQGIVSNRKKGIGRCPYCSGLYAIKGETDLATTNPELLLEWHPTKNSDITPLNITSRSYKKVWWQCSQKHEWKAVVNQRSQGSRCPYCSNKKALAGYNDLATTHPKLAKEWHPTLNGTLTPFDIISSTRKKIWWKCAQNHEWEAVVHIRTIGYGCCPECTRLAKLNEKNN